MFDMLEWDVGLVAGESDDTDNEFLTEHEFGREHEFGAAGFELVDIVQDQHVLPPDLESITPGPFLGAILSAVDPARLSGFDIVRYVQSQERLVSHYHAAYYDGVAELAHAIDADGTGRSPVPSEFASDELQAALAKTRRSADADVDLALDLKDRIPQVWEALRDGRVDVRRARVFARETETLHAGLIPDVVEPLLEEASELTTGQLGSRLRKLVIEADPEAAEDQYQAGWEDRKMVVYPNPDHTANLGLVSVDPLEAITASNHVHDLALKLKQLPAETRTLDQIKADIALDLLQGKTIDPPPEAIGPRVEVVVQTSTDSATGHIPGYGPVLISQLPKTTDHIEIDDTVNPDSNQSSSGECHQTPSRRPTKAQVDHIQQTYPTCIYPGCRQPAYRCDLDHRLPWHQGGKTTCTNLAPLCRHHHRCKDQGGWQLTRNPDRSHTWTSPLGHTYTTRAPP